MAVFQAFFNTMIRAEQVKENGHNIWWYYPPYEWFKNMYNHNVSYIGHFYVWELNFWSHTFNQHRLTLQLTRGHLTAIWIVFSREVTLIQCFLDIGVVTRFVWFLIQYQREENPREGYIFHLCGLSSAVAPFQHQWDLFLIRKQTVLPKLIQLDNLLVVVVVVVHLEELWPSRQGLAAKPALHLLLSPSAGSWVGLLISISWASIGPSSSSESSLREANFRFILISYWLFQIPFDTTGPFWISITLAQLIGKTPQAEKPRQIFHSAVLS